MEINVLRETIRKYADAYYNEDAPLVTDAEYDALMHQLRQMEEEHPELITPDSPTQVVGGKRVIGIPVEHEVPMLSLLDVFDEGSVEQFVDFSQRSQEGKPVLFDVEYKIDGLSLSLVYKDGKLVQASTRGDGHIGEDVTANVMALPTIPKTLKVKRVDLLEVRCECYMSEKDFLRVNEEQEKAGKKVFANPRNCAAGTLRQAEPKVAAKRNLRVIAFNVQKAIINGKLVDSGSHAAQMNALKSLGFQTATAKNGCKTLDEVLAAIKEIGEKRYSLDFPMDGAVVKVDSLELRTEMGERAKTPRWAVAFKYPPEEKSTVIRSVEGSVSRFGRLTPVAVFDPIQLGGTTVQRATLNNMAFINTMGIRIGSRVVVRKAAEIIPQIVMVEKTDDGEETQPIVFDKCPVCGSPVVDMTCTNPVCKGRIVSQILYFASRPCMDIKGLGETMIWDLVESKFLERPEDLYDLHIEKAELVDMYGQKTVDKVLAAIEKSKQMSADHVLKAIGWSSVGGTVAKTLLKKYGSILSLFDCRGESRRQELYDSIVSLPGIGDTIAKSVVAMVNDLDMYEEVAELNMRGVNMVYTQASVSGDDAPLAGKTFVITGKFNTFSRSSAVAFIESYGGKVSGSVSKKTDYLLAGSDAGSKLDKAKALGIEIIDEVGIYNMVGLAMPA